MFISIHGDRYESKTQAETMNMIIDFGSTHAGHIAGVIVVVVGIYALMLYFYLDIVRTGKDD